MPDPKDGGVPKEPFLPPVVNVGNAPQGGQLVIGLLPRPNFSDIFPRVPRGGGRSIAASALAAERQLWYAKFKDMDYRSPVNLDVTEIEVTNDSPFKTIPPGAVAQLSTAQLPALYPGFKKIPPGIYAVEWPLRGYVIVSVPADGGPWRYTVPPLPRAVGDPELPAG